MNKDEKDAYNMYHMLCYKIKNINDKIDDLDKVRYKAEESGSKLKYETYLNKYKVLTERRDMYIEMRNEYSYANRLYTNEMGG